jgi:RNA polymerase sigma-70 factor (ECF subfamily)
VTSHNATAWTRQRNVRPLENRCRKQPGFESLSLRWPLAAPRQATNQSSRSFSKTDRGPSGHVGAMADNDVFRHVFEAHFDDVWRFARRRCASNEDADDVTAETFAVAWRRRDEVGSDDVRLWLFGVARLVVANHRRGARRREQLQLRLVSHPDVSEPDLVDRMVDAQSLQAALASLNDDDRDIVVMRCWDGLTVREIATLLGCGTNAVSVRLYKIRGRLVEHLSAEDLADGDEAAVDPVPPKEQRNA